MKKYSAEDQRVLAAWAADCAEHVLPFFEKAFPSDNRPRLALEVCRKWVASGRFRMKEIREASLSAHAAAREAKDFPAAFNAARAAGHAVATAHVAQHAFGVFYALRAVAAAFPDDAEAQVQLEFQWQADHLPPHLREEFIKRVVMEKRRKGLFITICKDSAF